MYLYEYTSAPAVQWTMVAIVAGSAAVHALIFALWPTSDAKSAMFRSRVASNFHATVATVAVLWWITNIDLVSMERLVLGVVEDGDWVFPYTIAFSVGYFVADMGVMLTHRATVLSAESVIHHCVVGGGFALGLFYGATTPYHFIFLAEEASTIFLNLRYFWRKSPVPYKIFSYAFAATFLAVRMVFGSIVFASVVPILANPSAPAVVGLARFRVLQIQVFLCALSRLLNAYWAYLIIAAFFPASNSDKAKSD